MNHDDNAPAMGVRTDLVVATGDEAALGSSTDEIDPNLGIAIRDLNLFNAYWHELGVLDGEDPRPNTPEEQKDVDDLYARGLAYLAMSPSELREERRRRRRR